MHYGPNLGRYHVFRSDPASLIEMLVMVPGICCPELHKSAMIFCRVRVRRFSLRHGRRPSGMNTVLQHRHFLDIYVPIVKQTWCVAVVD